MHDRKNQQKCDFVLKSEVLIQREKELHHRGRSIDKKSLIADLGCSQGTHSKKVRGKAPCSAKEIDTFYRAYFDDQKDVRTELGIGGPMDLCHRKPWRKAAPRAGQLTRQTSAEVRVSPESSFDIFVPKETVNTSQMEAAAHRALQNLPNHREIVKTSYYGTIDEVRNAHSHWGVILSDLSLASEPWMSLNDRRTLLCDRSLLAAEMIGMLLTHFRPIEKQHRRFINWLRDIAEQGRDAIEPKNPVKAMEIELGLLHDLNDSGNLEWFSFPDEFFDDERQAAQIDDSLTSGCNKAELRGVSCMFEYRFSNIHQFLRRARACMKRADFESCDRLVKTCWEKIDRDSPPLATAEILMTESDCHALRGCTGDALARQETALGIYGADTPQWIACRLRGAQLRARYQGADESRAISQISEQEGLSARIMRSGLRHMAHFDLGLILPS